MTDQLDIVFDGPPEHVAGRFVDVEDAQGRGIKFGDWVDRPDGYWALRFDLDSIRAEAWDEGHGAPCDKWVVEEMCREFHPNPYRKADR